MSIYAIGDIHGHYDEFIKLYDKLNITDEDEVVFLGDYIDRGKDSKEVLDKVMELSSFDNHHFLLGNHEDMMLDYFLNTGKYKDGHWLTQGGQETLDSFGGYVPDEYIDFIGKLAYGFVTDDYIFVHAGVDLGVSEEENVKRILTNKGDKYLWIRYEFIGQPTGFKRKVVFGHTSNMFENGVPIMGRDAFDENYDKFGIDGGVYKNGGSIIAIILPQEEFVIENSSDINMI